MYPLSFSLPQRVAVVLLALICSISSACLQPKSGKLALTEASNRVELPSLLPRHAGLGSAEEQAEMKRIYADLNRKIQADPTDFRSRLQLVQLYILEARVTGEHGHYYPAALSVLDQMLRENPPTDAVFGAKSLKATVLLSLHHFSEAKTLAEEAVQLNGYNSLIYGSLVDANVELGEYETAVQMADKMVSIRPDLRSYSRVSYLRELSGDLPGAIEAMKMAAEAGYPGYEETAWCRLTLGHLYETAGKLDQARIQYEQILAERANYPFAIAAIARVEAKTGNFATAEQRLLEATDILPEVSFYEQLGALYQEMGRAEEANATFQEVLVMLADDEEKGHHMGMEYAKLYMDQLGDLDEALAYAHKEYELRPNNIEVNQLMAAVHYKRGELAKAKQYLEVAMRTNSQNPELLCLAGLIYVHNQEMSKGKQLIQQVFQTNPYQDHAFAGEARTYLQS